MPFQWFSRYTSKVTNTLLFLYHFGGFEYLWATIWELGLKPSTSGGTASAPNQQAIFPVPVLLFFIFIFNLANLILTNHIYLLVLFYLFV